MSRTLGAKIDARLLLLEAALEKEKERVTELMVTLAEFMVRLEAVEAKRGPGRSKNE